MYPPRQERRLLIYAPMQSVDETLEPQRRTQRVALAALVVLAFIAVAWMAAPLLVGLALGTVMAFTAQPIQVRLSARLHNRGGLASAITTLLGGLVMAGGGAGLLWVMAREIVAAVQLVQRELQSGSSGLFGAHVMRLLAALGIPHAQLVARLRDELGRLANVAAEGARLLVETSMGVLLTIVIALWTMYYVLRDWPRIEHHLERVLPLHPRHTRALVSEFRNVGRQAFVGTVATAVAQGTIAGIGFALFGVPQPVMWGALLGLLSFIPTVGTLLVWVPAAVWLATTGHLGRALLLTAYSLIFVMAANDYFIRPRLVGRGGANPLLMLVALIGGISVFGFAGVIVGPVIMSLFVASVHIYERENAEAF